MHLKAMKVLVDFWKIVANTFLLGQKRQIGGRKRKKAIIKKKYGENAYRLINQGESNPVEEKRHESVEYVENGSWSCIQRRHVHNLFSNGSISKVIKKKVCLIIYQLYTVIY
jgi:hypothetical protein